MKIGFVINKATYTSIPIELAGLLANGNEVSILVLYDSQEKAEKTINKAAPNCEARGFDIKRKAAGIIAFASEIRSGKYDIIHTHQNFSGSLARFLSNGKSKIVHTVHENHNSFSGAQNFILGITLGKCDAIVFNSNASRMGLKNWQKRIVRDIRQEVIYNGINTKRIAGAGDSYASEICKRYNIDDETYLFCQVGRLEPVKNPMGSLIAFNKFITDNPAAKARMIFVGDGSQKARLKEYIDNNFGLIDKVHMLGTIERDDVYSLLHRVNGMIVSSFYEGFCNALFEGLAAGVPFAISDISVFRELIEEDLGLLRFDPNNTESIAQSMATMYGRKNMTDTESLARFAFEHFDTQICIDNYLALYKSII